MTWTSSAPDGSKSARENRPLLSGNTDYIEAKMQLDHYWAEDANKDGHHRYVQAPKYEDGGGAPDDPALAADMDAVLYFKQKLALGTDVKYGSSSEEVQTFFRNETTPNFLQLLGCTSMALFRVSGETLTQYYGHNVAVVRNSTGRFTATFATPHNNDEYFMIGGCNLNVESQLTNLQVSQYTTALSEVKTAGMIKFVTVRQDVSATVALVDPVEAWFITFGG